MAKKIQVSFSDKQIELLSKLKGELGETDADVVRSIVIAWLFTIQAVSSEVLIGSLPLGYCQQVASSISSCMQGNQK